MCSCGLKVRTFSDVLNFSRARCLTKICWAWTVALNIATFGHRCKAESSIKPWWRICRYFDSLNAIRPTCLFDLAPLVWTIEFTLFYSARYFYLRSARPLIGALCTGSWSCLACIWERKRLQCGRMCRWFRRSRRFCPQVEHLLWWG